MADYRRFISYMYVYENGKKTVNSGFVRVESRNGQCRLHIHMTGISEVENAGCRVYMLVREAGGYIGIEAGILKIRNHTGELDVVTDSSRLLDTEYGLDRISGMVVLGDGSRIHGTRWDDELLETECFVSGRKLSDRLTLFGTQLPAPVSAPAEEAMPEMVSDSEAAVAPVPELTLDSEAALPSVSELTLDSEAALPPVSELASDSEAVLPPVSDAVAASVPDSGRMHELPKTSMEESLEEMMQQFPQMYPFDDNSIEFCVRLDLQDIGRLPMQCWLYGSNSFLLHGYYCYRHLILARISGKTGTADTNGADAEMGAMANAAADQMAQTGSRYILGVPGVWQHREQYMASMFGFRSFKPVSRESVGSGAFGYWFVSLK